MLGQDGEHSGERAARCDLPVFAAPGGEMSSLQIASEACIFVHHVLSGRRKATRKALVENGVVQKEVCVKWRQFVSRLKYEEFSGRCSSFGT
jgi:hypothetical protein